MNTLTCTEWLSRAPGLVCCRVYTVHLRPRPSPLAQLCPVPASASPHDVLQLLPVTLQWRCRASLLPCCEPSSVSAHALHLRPPAQLRNQPVPAPRPRPYSSPPPSARPTCLATTRTPLSTSTWRTHTMRTLLPPTSSGNGAIRTRTCTRPHRTQRPPRLTTTSRSTTW